MNSPWEIDWNSSSLPMRWPHPLREFKIPDQATLDTIIWRESVRDEFVAHEQAQKMTFWSMKNGNYSIQIRPWDEIQIIGQLKSGEWACMLVMDSDTTKKDTDAEDDIDGPWEDFYPWNYVRVPDDIIRIWLSIIDENENTREKEWWEVKQLMKFAAAEFWTLINDTPTPESTPETVVPEATPKETTIWWLSHWKKKLLRSIEN